jgi:hypothetical protein
MAGRISVGARREVVSAVAERYRSANQVEKGRILDELCATTGWHRKHAVRALRQRETVTPVPGHEAPRARRRRYGAAIKDALTALWEASDRLCGKRLKVMIPTLLPPLEQHGRLRLNKMDRDLVFAISAATIDRMLGDTKVAASGARRRRAGFYSAIRREVPIRTFNDWNSPPPGFCEVDMVAHGGTSVAGSFIQTLTMVDVATGWTECLPLVTRDGSLVVEAINRAQDLFPWLLRGVDFDNDSAFMNDVVVPWCREQKLELENVATSLGMRAAKRRVLVSAVRRYRRAPSRPARSIPARCGRTPQKMRQGASLALPTVNRRPTLTPTRCRLTPSPAASFATRMRLKVRELVPMQKSDLFVLAWKPAKAGGAKGEMD